MKNRYIISLVLLIVLSTTLIGCGAKEKVDEAINPSNQTTENGNIQSEPEKAEDIIEVSNDIKEQAEKEGVSVKELQETLDGLAEIGAQKYGITTVDYIKQIESSGNTILSEWQVASEHMGISITELYEYEKAKGDNLTDEQKEMMQGMDNALKMAESELANIPSIGTTNIGNLMGIEENATGEIRVATMSDEELKEALAYNVYKVTQDYVDEYSVLFDYTSDADIDELVEHYGNLLLNTEGYTKIGTPDNLVVTYQGMINETAIYIEIDSSQGGMATVATYIDLSTKE